MPISIEAIEIAGRKGIANALLRRVRDFCSDKREYN
jgi:Holliday junction resolvasome RuvABC ATP-dependent DNA helicase subunit